MSSPSYTPTPTASQEIQVGALPHRSLLALIWTCFSTAFFLVFLRTFVRVRSGNRLTPDDYLMFLALTCLLSLCVLETIQLPSVYYITAVLAGAVPISEDIIARTEDYLRYQFPIVILFWSVLWSVKAAFLGLYWKIFRDLPVYRKVWYALAVFTFLAYGGCVVTLSLSCGPNIRNFFGFAQCAKPENVWASNFSVYWSTGSDVLTDLCIMAMPLRLIYNVKVSVRQKIGLVAIFSLGFVMIAFAIIRAKQVLVEQAFVNLTLLMIWSTLAGSISVIVGTLPALKVLITTQHRASANRSDAEASAATRRKNSNFNSKSVPLASISKEKKSLSGSHSEGMESQEEILVQHDVTVSYSDREDPDPHAVGIARPYPAHDRHQHHQYHNYHDNKF
ncbi:hypothetical protein QBC35DRAFT_33679 [Podospora australis]|uniref:Rhodopsin domain-containing protein n=1 Tax=Podospora australis TaxID=1536484 RepID=A0AAN6WNA2_9PEZI|nr:hypothetical protein QBC35DRAFT_33679 [Podospora australis]